MLSSRAATIVTSGILVASVALFVWIAVTAASGGQEPPQGGPTRGATPEQPTPTLGPARETSRSAAIETIEGEGGGAVLERAASGDVDGLLGLVQWDQLACDSPKLIARHCTEIGVPPGTRVPVTNFENSTNYVDRGFVGAFLEVLVGTPDAELVFAARKDGRLGLSFAVPDARPRPMRGGPSFVRGIWFEVIPGNPGTIERIYFFTEFSGPRQFYQHFYQPEGGEVLFFDEARAPASGAAPTPDAPPTRP